MQIAMDSTGKAITTWRNAVTSIATLRHALTNGLEVYDVHRFHPQREEYGPGVYEWARHNGFHMLLRVALREAWFKLRAKAGQCNLSRLRKRAELKYDHVAGESV